MSRMHRNSRPRLQEAPHTLTSDYAAFVRRYFAHLAPVACADEHLRAAAAVRAVPRYHGLWMWFRGAAKSTHASLMLPLWLAVQGELRFGLIVGKSALDARRLLADIRAELDENAALLRDFEIVVEQSTLERVRFACGGQAVVLRGLGMGQSPRGLKVRAQRPDYIVADDLDHAALSRRPARVRRLAQWVLEDLLGTFDVGRGRFVQVNNRFSRHTIIHQLAELGRFDISRLDARDAEGRVSWPAKYGDGAWLDEREQRLGYTAFQREYQNTPVDDGQLFDAAHVRYVAERPLADYRRIVAYIDPSAGGPSGDYQAVKVWGRLAAGPGRAEGPCHHQLAAFVRRASGAELAAWCCALYRRWGQPGQMTFAIEANFDQGRHATALRAEAHRQGFALPLSEDRRKKPDKQARLQAIALLWRQGDVAYLEGQQHCPDTRRGLEQWWALGESQAHDDGPDADEGALTMLNQPSAAEALQPLVGRRTSAGLRAW